MKSLPFLFAALLLHAATGALQQPGGGGIDGWSADGAEGEPQRAERTAPFTPHGFALRVLSGWRFEPISAEGGRPLTLAEHEALLPGGVIDAAPQWVDLYAHLGARADGGAGPREREREREAPAAAPR